MRRSRRNRRLRRMTVNTLAAVAFAAVATIAFHALADAAAPDTWRGLAVAPEDRCAPYDRSDYPYPPSVEAKIVASMGGRVYGPYTGRFFLSMKETDIEHVVAVSEAHDSGLCAAGDAGSPNASPPTAPAATSDALRLWDDNGNGRITCKEARRHGIAPVPRGHPAYPHMNDRDGDGVVCE